MESEVEKIMKELVAIKSFTHSETEFAAGEYIFNFLQGLEYFKKNCENAGLYKIPGDTLKRGIPYGFIQGKSKDTVILMGHYDVVGVEEYGEAGELAFCADKELLEWLNKKGLSPDAEKDMNSGEWIWGRGTADMKSGVASNMAITQRYADEAMRKELEGSLMFIAVPDEESYSDGMRASLALLKAFKEKYDLNYKLMIDPEPTACVEGKQTVYLGSVGKLMPVIMVQGVKAHVGHFFNGISPMDILTAVYQRTHGSVDFVDHINGEATMPPAWLCMRDMKKHYDVTLPYRAYGYMSLMSLYTTPEEILKKIIKISEECLEEEINKIDKTYQAYKELADTESRNKISFEHRAMSFSELVKMLHEKRGKAFDEFYEGAYKKIGSDVENGLLNYPDATVKLMEETLDFADFNYPVVIVGFAPPFYPAAHSDKACGKDNYGTAAFEFLSRVSTEEYSQPLKAENYFMGISDASYSVLQSNTNYGFYSENAPLWGRLYKIDFDAIGQINVPTIIYGPLGKEYHQWTERVNKHSAFTVTPQVTMKLIEYMWRL